MPLSKVGAGISSAARHLPAPPAARGWGFARIQLPSAGKKSISHLCWYELFSAPPTPVFAAQVSRAWAAKKKNNTTFYLLAVIVLCECVQLKGNMHLLAQPSDRPVCSHVEAGDVSNATFGQLLPGGSGGVSLSHLAPAAGVAEEQPTPSWNSCQQKAAARG